MSRPLSCILKLKKLIPCTSRPLTFCYLANKRLCKLYGTSIYISERYPKQYFEFDHGLEEKFKDIDGLKRNCQRRGCDVDIDILVSNYEKVKSLHLEKKELEKKRIENALQMNNLVKQKVKTDESKQVKQTLIGKGKELKDRFKHVQDSLWYLEQSVMEQALSLPNNLLSEVKEREEVIETYLKGQELMTSSSHMDLIESTGEVEFSNVGKKAYYLRGKLAVLEQNLIHKFSSELRQRELTCMLAPEIFTTPIVETGCLDVTDPNAISRMNIKHEDPAFDLDWQIDNTFLYGASHLSFLAYFARTVLDKSTPDSKYFVVGRNYLAAEDESLPGLLGVLQSVKVCMCSVNVEEENSLVAMETFIRTLTDIYKQFNVPFRVVSMPIGRLTPMEKKRIEVQLWVPSLNNYLKIGSVSAVGDYGSRRLMMRCSENRSLMNTDPVYMVHSEVTNITRLIAILIENGRIKDL